MIVVNWYGFMDGIKGSGIVEYKYKIIDSCGMVILFWIFFKIVKSIIYIGLFLMMVVKYFVSVMVIDVVGFMVVVVSNGVIVVVGKKSNLCFFEYLNGVCEVVKRYNSKS